MFRVMEYRRRRGPGQSLFNPRVHTAQKTNPDEARRTPQTDVRSIGNHSNKSDKDYWWGWNDQDETGVVYVVEPDPTSKIA